MKCLTPNCESDKVYSRGLCKKCYFRLAMRVHRGTAKWGELIDQGLATKASNKGYCGKSAKSGNDEVRWANMYLKQGYKGKPGDLSLQECKYLHNWLGFNAEMTWEEAEAVCFNSISQRDSKNDGA